MSTYLSSLADRIRGSEAGPVRVVDLPVEEPRYRSPNNFPSLNEPKSVAFRKEVLSVEQDGRCAICGVSETIERLYLDHCHETGRDRGLLCRMCNTGLGFMQDNPAWLLIAAAYLEDHRAQR